MSSLKTFLNFKLRKIHYTNTLDYIRMIVVERGGGEGRLIVHIQRNEENIQQVYNGLMDVSFCWGE